MRLFWRIGACGIDTRFIQRPQAAASRSPECGPGMQVAARYVSSAKGGKSLVNTSRLLPVCAAFLLGSCGSPGDGESSGRPSVAVTNGPARLIESTGAHGTWQSSGSAADDAPPAAIEVSDVAGFDEPWAMDFLPDGRLLVAEKKGRLKLVDAASGRISEVSGVPEVVYEGQGGFGDVLVHPQHADNRLIYMSYVERGEADLIGAAVASAVLVPGPDGTGGSLQDMRVVWRQEPKVAGAGHYSHRMLIDSEGKLWISSGDRKRFDPAQDLAGNLGKIVRLNSDGSVPAGNPFSDRGGVSAQIWSLGHRNVLGMAFDADGRLWAVEMGPAGGDELNLVTRGGNYGYPLVSWGNHYDGRDIPDHDTRPAFAAPAIWWDPVISPSSLMIYSGDLFPRFKGNGFITGLSSNSLVRVAFNGAQAREIARYDMGTRMRAVKQGPGGTIWLLQDGPGGRLIKLVDPEQSNPVTDAPAP